MTDWKDWLWLVKTNKGDFFITVFGRWTQEEAAKKLQLLFLHINLAIIAMIPRKRATGDMDAMATLYQQDPPEDKLGFSCFAGKSFWAACGRGALYEAELIRAIKGDNQA